jgi:hypothetical protein
MRRRWIDDPLPGTWTSPPASNRILAGDEADALMLTKSRKYAEKWERREAREAQKKAEAKAKITLPKLKFLEEPEA